MLGLYLSGTGNTRHCVEGLLKLLDQQAEAVAMEDDAAEERLQAHDFVILGYPTQFSDIPIMVRDFIIGHKHLWAGKKVLCLTTMGLFSGDGTGCAARLLSRYGAKIIGGLQIQMPDSICDEKALKHTNEKNCAIIRAADEKIARAAEQIKTGQYPKEGLSAMAHMVGLFGQRLWFGHKVRHYSNQLKINDACQGCGLCVQSCSMHNLTLNDGKVVQGGKCTMCYRCLNQCPQKAITLLGKSVYKQYRFEKYELEKTPKKQA